MIKCIQMDSQSWKDLPWKKFQRHLFGLQVRVFKATQRKDNKKVLALQKLIAKSSSTRYLAIREVIRPNKWNFKEKSTSFVLEDHEFWELEKQLKEDLAYCNHNTFISGSLNQANPEKDKTMLPMIRKKAWQCAHAFILDPVHKTNFYTNRNRCKKESSTKNAQKWMLRNLNSIKNPTF